MWSLRKLKKWAGSALRHEELVEIARTAPSAKQAKNQALEFAKNQGLEEEEAKACRWLMIIRRDYGPKTQQEYIVSAKEAIAREERKMEKKIKKRKKTKGWPIYYCSLCQKYQQVEGQCERCGFEKTKRIVAKTGAEYCELLGWHEFENVGQTGVISKYKDGFLGNTYYIYNKVHRCIRCNLKKVEANKENTVWLPPQSWGEQP